MEHDPLQRAVVQGTDRDALSNTATVWSAILYNKLLTSLYIVVGFN